MQHLGLKARKNVMNVYITPMIEAGLLEMTEPDSPTSRNQMYVAAKNIEKANSSTGIIFGVFIIKQEAPQTYEGLLVFVSDNNVYRYGYIPLCPFRFQ